MGIVYYVYKENEFSIDDSFQKKKLVDFVGRLDYIGGVSPLDEDGKKLLKRLIEVFMLVASSSREGCRFVLVNLKFPLFFIVNSTLLSVCVGITIVFICKYNGGRGKDLCLKEGNTTN